MVVNQLHHETGEIPKAFRPKKKFILTMSDVAAEEQQFLVQPYIPVGIFTLLQGRGGVGKSLLTSYWIAELSSGRIPMEGDALLIGDEDAAPITRARLAAMGADLD